MDIPTLFFKDHPSPMLIFDTDTLEILEVNKSAEKKYGFSGEEFRQLTIEDIRPPEDIPIMRDKIKELRDKSKILDIGTLRHRTKEGEILYVQVATQVFPMEERNARIVHIHDISETIRLKKEIEESYRDQHQHIQKNPLGMVKYDKNFRILEWSQRAVEKTGYTKDEMLGASIMEMGLFAEGENEEVKLRMQNISLGKIDQDRFETVIRVKDGSRMDVRVHVSALRSKQGTLKSVLAFIENITEQKKIKNDLEVDQERLKRAQSLARIGWWSYEVEKNKVLWSDVLYDILDVDKRKFGATFEAFYELVYPADREKLQNIMKQANQTEEAIDYMLRIGEPKDENIIYAKCRVQSNFDSEGNLVRLSGVLQDVTDQHIAQQELKRREKLFESLFLDSPVAIVMIDTEGKVQKLNKSFENLFGYSENQLKGKDLLKHQLPEDRYDEIDTIYENVFSNEGASKYYEDTRVTKVGEEKDLLVGALPVNIDGEPIGAFGIYTDITRLRSIEQNLKESLREKEVLLSEIHHRVKNNLAIISGLLLLESMNWEEESTVHKVLMQSKLRIHSMAKIHEKLYESEDFANLNLEDYVEELIDTISLSIKGPENGVNIDIDCDEMYLNINQALPSALIINELVTNSFKYAFNGGQDNNLEIKFKQEGEEVNIVVADNGPGLPNDFEKMAENSLGHQLVGQLVKQLDGEIDVETGKNDGTRYKIVFKRAKKSGSASNLFV